MTQEVKQKVPMHMIFEYNGSCWKIIGFSQAHQFGTIYCNYQVIKCNKLGKEFKAKNSFAASFVESDKCKKWMAVKNEKANTKGVESGIRKRRISFLKAEIEAMTKELEQLLELENA